MSISDTVKDFIRREIIRDNDIDFGDGESLITGGLIDSMDLVKLSVFIKNELGVQIPDFRMTTETMNTLRDIVHLIDEFQLKECLSA